MPTLKLPNQSLVENVPSTVLLSDLTTTGQTSIPVINSSISGSTGFIIIEQIGHEKCEILSVTANASNVITTSATKYTHSANSVVFFVDYDQIEYSYATTTSGTKTVLATKNLAVSDLYTYYIDNTYSSGYAFTRLKNSVTSAFSDYSSPIPYSYSKKSARELKQSALLELGEEDSPRISDEFIYRMINKCQSEVITLRKNGKFPFLKTHNAVLGTMSEGGWRLPLPSNIQVTDTDESIEEVRFGRGKTLRYRDQAEWFGLIYGVGYSEIISDITTGDSTIYGANFGDFPDSGSVFIAGMEIEYTGKTSTTLTGCTGITSNVSSGATAFYNVSKGTPEYYTVQDGYIYVYPVVNNSTIGNNIVMSYFHKPETIANAYDETVIPDETAVIDYLCSKIIVRLDGVNNESQNYMNSFLIKAEKMRKQVYTGRKIFLKTKVFNSQ